MRNVIISMLLVDGFIASSSLEASAVVCARGIYRAGCVGQNGSVVVHRTYVARHRVVVRRY